MRKLLFILILLLPLTALADGPATPITGKVPYEAMLVGCEDEYEKVQTVKCSDIGGGGGGGGSGSTSQSSESCKTITPSTTAYSANDSIGGVQEFTTLFGSKKSGALQSVTVVDSSVSGVGFKFCYFNANPSSSTTSDNSGLSIASGDADKWLGCVDLDEHSVFGTELYQNTMINRAMVSGSTSLFGVLVSNGSVTYTSGQSLRVCVDVIKD